MELTESAVMSDPEESIAILEQLSTMGVLVSVDDFGTGYSSMSYLRRFPIDKLKIDRGVHQRDREPPDDASIVRAIVSLAHSLRLKVVAEGVETPAQLDFLKAVGCDEYQGYHFSRPLPAREFDRIVRETAAQHGTAECKRKRRARTASSPPTGGPDRRSEPLSGAQARFAGHVQWRMAVGHMRARRVSWPN